MSDNRPARPTSTHTPLPAPKRRGAAVEGSMMNCEATPDASTEESSTVAESGSAGLTKAVDGTSAEREESSQVVPARRRETPWRMLSTVSAWVSLCTAIATVITLPAPLPAPTSLMEMSSRACRTVRPTSLATAVWTDSCCQFAWSHARLRLGIPILSFTSPPPSHLAGRSEQVLAAVMSPSGASVMASVRQQPIEDPAASTSSWQSEEQEEAEASQAASSKASLFAANLARQYRPASL
mmetsp:Transcript_61542/g.144772  ORF Transcript_61542/g.144772 Transcript_61542/m.144772 type:complete len:239 (+) Transcript_61542:579-1295(+)